MRRPFLLAVTSAVLVLSACSSSSGVEVHLAPVGRGEVVQTVAAGAQLDAAERATVTAPVGGEVARLLVGDGERVAAGEPLVRLASDTVDAQIRQAEMAVDAAEELATVSAGAGLDLSPVVEAFGAQLDAVFPPLIGALEDQIATLEVAVTTAEDSLQAVRDGLDDARQQILDRAAQAPVALHAPDLESALPHPEMPPLVDASGLRAAAADVRQRLAEAEAGYRRARGELAQVASDLEHQAQQTSAAQSAAAQAQRDQAELALESARARVDDLTIVAPLPGVIELARGGDTSSGAPAGGLDALAGLGGADGASELSGLLAGGDEGGATSSSAGPLAEGAGVRAGQPLLTIFDVSSFTVRAGVDEIDVVDVAVGQSVTVLVDAFPEAELPGTVRHVALSPERPPGGGAIFPVTVELDGSDDIDLRVGLTASVEIETDRLDGDLVLPTSALLRRGGNEVVYVARDGVAIEVPITVEAIGDESAAVTGDLRIGDQVVTSGVELVEDGVEIEVVE